MSEPKKVKWAAANADGVRESKCGRFTISKEEKYGRDHGYRVRDSKTEESVWRERLSDAKEWADEAPLRAFPRVYFTYAAPPLREGYGRTINLHSEPSAFNGAVNVTRYRVTVEKVSTVEEEIEEIKRLWRECKNSHLRGPLESAALARGIKLSNKDYGVDAGRGY